MNTRLQYLFEVLEADRVHLLEKISTLSDERFNASPPEKWSLHQILAHLITAERLSLRYMKKKILGIGETDDSGLIEEVKMALLCISQRLPLKFRAPRVVVDQTLAYSNFQGLRDDWDSERKEFRAFLETFEDHHLKRKIYKHVRAGKLNIQQGLRFTREHFLHHLPQINHLL